MWWTETKTHDSDLSALRPPMLGVAAMAQTSQGSLYSNSMAGEAKEIGGEYKSPAREPWSQRTFGFFDYKSKDFAWPVWFSG